MKQQEVSFPLSNSTFLNAINNSFYEFINIGTSRSTAKLKPLHGAIAKDIADVLGNEYKVFSQGYEKGKEAKIGGRYYDKAVDITIKKDDKAVAGVGVKFVMQNYSQNSNNYFENMLGETANIRSGKCPYFQIFIIFDKLPHYNKEKRIIHWEIFSKHNAEKYNMMSKDDTDTFMHTPNKTLIYVVHIPNNEELHNREEYREYYKSLDFEMQISRFNDADFDNAVIINDYEKFKEKVYHTIKAM